VSPDQVSAQLERILASQGFASADRASRFLRYVVERTIAGDGDQLKEYVIGRAVFDRTEDYDPRIDSIVRVEAGRLRSKLDEYYSGPGRTDSVLIQLPKGRYAPMFESRGEETAAPGAVDPAPAARTGSKRHLGLIATAAVFVLVALTALGSAMWPSGQKPAAETVVVFPFANYSTDQAEALLAARVTSGITAELARLGTIGVVSHTTAMQYPRELKRTSLREIAKTLNAQFVLEGNVRDESGHVTIQVVLVDATLDRKMWVHDVDGAVAEIPELQRQVAQAAAAAVIQRKR